MQHLKSGLLHATWADDQLFKKLQEIPEECLGFIYADPNWPVGKIATHIVDGLEWYKYVLTGVRWADVVPARSHSDLEELRIQAAKLHSIFIDILNQPDELISFEDENGPKQVMRSTVLNQICYHSTEHRAQIFVALQINGQTSISADDFDLWAWESSTK
jgi:uncharacterized damage-inducible protein DinB